MESKKLGLIVALKTNVGALLLYFAEVDCLPKMETNQIHNMYLDHC